MQGLIRDLKRNRTAYLMAVPAVILLLVFSYAPMYGILIAFKKYKPALGILGSPWIGFTHFETFFRSAHFLKLVRNTVCISLYSMAVEFPLPIVLALILNEVRAPKFKRTVQTITYMPYFISTVVICGILKQFLAYDGTLNAILKHLFGMEPVIFLNEARYFRSIIVWSNVWQGVGWNSIIYMAAIAGIDMQLYEAARIDGCGRFRQALYVTLPGIAPTIVILLILTMGSLFAVATDKILLLYTPLTYETGDVIGTYVYRKGIRGGDYSFSTAVGLAQTVVNFTLLIVVNNVSKRISEVSLW